MLYGSHALGGCQLGDDHGYTVTVQVANVTSDEGPYLRVRADGGDWRPPAAESEIPGVQTFIFRALESYVVFASCPDGNGTRVVEQYCATVPEVQEVHMSCDQAAPPIELVTIEGSLRQPGSVVVFSDSKQGVADDWSFAFQVPPVIGDIVAFDETRIAFRRSLLFDRPRQLSPIDLELEGSPLTDVPLTLAETLTGQVVTSSFLETRSGTFAALARFNDPKARVPAASALAPGDSLRVMFTQSTGAQIQGVTGPYEWFVTPIELLPALAPDVVPSLGVGVRLSRLPLTPENSVLLSLSDIDRRTSIYASGSWLSLERANLLELDPPADADSSWLAQGDVDRTVLLYDFPDDQTTRWSSISR